MVALATFKREMGLLVADLFDQTRPARWRRRGTACGVSRVTRPATRSTTPGVAEANRTASRQAAHGVRDEVHAPIAVGALVRPRHRGDVVG